MVFREASQAGVAPGWGEAAHEAEPSVLVVDDEAEIRTVIRMCLEGEGYRVKLAGDGRAALDAILAERPAVVLLDLNMPRMSGWELFDELRARGIDVPVLFMSAGRRASAEAERCGAAGWVPKPFDLDELLDAVARVSRGATLMC